MTFELMEPETEAEREHEAEHQPSATARVIATSRVALAIGDLIYAAKLLGRGEGFEGLHTIELAQEHLTNAAAQLGGTVWNITT